MVTQLTHPHESPSPRPAGAGAGGTGPSGALPPPGNCSARGGVLLGAALWRQAGSIRVGTCSRHIGGHFSKFWGRFSNMRGLSVNMRGIAGGFALVTCWLHAGSLHVISDSQQQPAAWAKAALW